MGVLVALAGALFGMTGYVVLVVVAGLWYANTLHSAFESFLFFAIFGAVLFGLALPEFVRSTVSDLFPLDVDQTFIRPLSFFASLAFGLLYGWLWSLAVPRTVRLP